MPVDRIGPFLRRSECTTLLDRVAPLPRLLSKKFVNIDQVRKEKDDVQPMLEILLNSGDDGMEDKILKTYKKMSDTAVFLREEVGIDDMGKVMSTYPDILMMDVERRIIPFFDFICDDLGIDEDDVPRIIESYPTLLMTDLREMKMIINYLVLLGVSVDMFPGIFRAFPSILTLDIETNLKPVVAFLQSIGVTNIGRFITRLPPVLGYSVENELKPKWEFLKKVCQYSSFEVRRFPAYFSYPLDRVIMGRYAYLHEKGIPARLLPVDDILRFGDADFARSVAKDLNGAAYSLFTAKRCKTNKRKSGQTKVQHAKIIRKVGEGLERNRISLR